MTSVSFIRGMPVSRLSRQVLAGVAFDRVFDDFDALVTDEALLDELHERIEALVDVEPGNLLLPRYSAGLA